MTAPQAPEPISQQVFETGHLMRAHPPVIRNRNKQLIYEIACPRGSSHRGQLRYSRWGSMTLPDAVDTEAAVGRVGARQGVYDYIAAGPGVNWHVNFADPHLFFAYGSALFAQDEIQVAEHPSLGALREALAARGELALTVEVGRPTPNLVMGVERRCHVATDRNCEAGRPDGPYGRAFARADEDAVRRATTPIAPPPPPNLIAMPAPNEGRGVYGAGEIEHILTTGFTGFRAAAFESAHCHGDDLPVLVHTGFWGCGAFEGNRVLMAALQSWRRGWRGWSS